MTSVTGESYALSARDMVNSTEAAQMAAPARPPEVPSIASIITAGLASRRAGPVCSHRSATAHQRRQTCACSGASINRRSGTRERFLRTIATVGPRKESDRRAGIEPGAACTSGWSPRCSKYGAGTRAGLRGGTGGVWGIHARCRKAGATRESPRSGSDGWRIAARSAVRSRGTYPLRLSVLNEVLGARA